MFVTGSKRREEDRKLWKSYDALVAACRGLRKRVELAEVEMFLFLVLLESNESAMALIHGNGCETFDQFLDSAKLVKPARYRNFVAGLGRLGGLDGADDARELGADAVIALVSTRDEAKTSDYLTAVAAWRGEHGGVMPSAETAAHLLRQVDPRAEQPAAVVRLTLVAQLQRENAKLRAEIKDLKAQLAAARKRTA